MPATGKFKLSHVFNGNVPWPCVFVVGGIAELRSTGAVVFLFHLCKSNT